MHVKTPDYLYYRTALNLQYIIGFSGLKQTTQTCTIEVLYELKKQRFTCWGLSVVEIVHIYHCLIFHTYTKSRQFKSVVSASLLQTIKEQTTKEQQRWSTLMQSEYEEIYRMLLLHELVQAS